MQALDLPALRDQASTTLRHVDVAVTIVTIVAVLAVVILAASTLRETS